MSRGVDAFRDLLVKSDDDLTDAEKEFLDRTYAESSAALSGQPVTTCTRCGVRAVTRRTVTLWSAPLNRDVTIRRPECEHCGAAQKGV